MGQVNSIQDLDTGLVREFVQLSPCDGDPRVFVLPGGVHIPVCRQEEEILLVGQVQLRHECGTGCGNRVCHCYHVLCVRCECSASFFVVSLADRTSSSRSVGRYLSTGGATGYGWRVSRQPLLNLHTV